MAANPRKSVGLGGDGDEIAAIADVERAFGIELEYADASRWFTDGDVFRSLRKVLPMEDRDSPDLWKRFAVVLCRETGVNPNDIEQDSPLLSRSRLRMHVANASAAAWIAAAAIMITLLFWALV